MSGKLRECFTDNAVIGGITSVAGIASATTPTLGGLVDIPRDPLGRDVL